MTLKRRPQFGKGHWKAAREEAFLSVIVPEVELEERDTDALPLYEY